MTHQDDVQMNALLTLAKLVLPNPEIGEVWETRVGVERDRFGVSIHVNGEDVSEALRPLLLPCNCLDPDRCCMPHGIHRSLHRGCFLR